MEVTRSQLYFLRTVSRLLYLSIYVQVNTNPTIADEIRMVAIAASGALDLVEELNWNQSMFRKREDNELRFEALTGRRGSF